MNNTLVLYESNYGTTEKTAKIISCIIGNSKPLNIKNAPNNIDAYSNIVLCFSLFGSKTGENTIQYLKENNFNFQDKKLSIVCVGLSKKDCMKYISKIQNITNVSDIYYNFLLGELIINKLTTYDKQNIESFCKTINHPVEDVGNFNINKAVELAINIRNYLNTPIHSVSKNNLKEAISVFLKKHNTATLATGFNNFVRATPIEYIFKDNIFYFLSEGGLKYVGILQNENVSIAIYENYKSMNTLQGLQIQGICKMVDINSKEYEEVLDYKNINIKNIEKFPINLNLFKVIPKRYEFLNSDFKNLGFDVKQIL